MGSKYTLRPLRREDKELLPVVEVAYPALGQKAPDGEGRQLTGHLPQFVAVSSLSSCACSPLWRPFEPSVPPLFDLFFLDRIPSLLVAPFFFDMLTCRRSVIYMYDELGLDLSS